MSERAALARIIDDECPSDPDPVHFELAADRIIADHISPLRESLAKAEAEIVQLKLYRAEDRNLGTAKARDEALSRAATAEALLSDVKHALTEMTSRDHIFHSDKAVLAALLAKIEETKHE